MNTLLVSFSLFLVLGVSVATAADNTTTVPSSTPATAVVNTTTVNPHPTNPNGQPSPAPWYDPNNSPATAAVVIFTIGGLILVAQIVYCWWWNKQPSEIPEAGALTDDQRQESTVDMEGQHQA